MYHRFTLFRFISLLEKNKITYSVIFLRAQDRFYYEPVHLNHADAGSPGCNVIRVLDGERMCFFTSRDIKEGEELAYDYGEDFWVGREDMKV